MTGRRIIGLTDGSLEGVQPGDYWRDSTGSWMAACPEQKLPEYRPDYAHRLCLAGLSKHQVTEHEDGTITVSPSILVKGPWGPDRADHEWYHGFLERGVWRSC
jgi:hypothetical protein